MSRSETLGESEKNSDLKGECPRSDSNRQLPCEALASKASVSTVSTTGAPKKRVCQGANLDRPRVGSEQGDAFPKLVGPWMDPANDGRPGIDHHPDTASEAIAPPRFAILGLSTKPLAGAISKFPESGNPWM